MRTPSQAVAGKLSRATTAVIFTGFVFAGSESLAVEREHPTLTLRTPLELDIRPHREMRTDQTSPLAARPEALLTWNAPNSGLFSDPANWSAGVPGAGDDLNFGGTGAASYVAQNDQVLVSYGNVVVNRSGTGTTTIVGPIDALRLRVDAGNFEMSGDADFTAVGENPFGSSGSLDPTFSVGNVAGQTATYTQSSGNVAVFQSGAVAPFATTSVGNMPGATGIFNLNGGTFLTQGVMGVGNGTGTYNISAGIAAAGQFQPARNAGSSGTLNLGGGAEDAELQVIRLWGSFDDGNAQLNVGANGVLIVGSTTSFNGQAVLGGGDGNSSFELNMTDGAVLGVFGNSFIGSYSNNLGAPVAGTTNINLSGNGTLYRTLGSETAGGLMSLADGAFTAGNLLNLNVSDGAQLRAEFIYTSRSASDVLNLDIDGGSVVSDFLVYFGLGRDSGKGGTDNVTIRNGGSLTTGDLYMAIDGGFTSGGGMTTITVTGTGSSLNVVEDAELENFGQLIVGYGRFGGTTATLNVLNGATASSSRIYAGLLPGTTANINVDGAESTLTAGGVIWLGGGTSTNGTLNPGGTVNMTVSNGGSVVGGDVLAGYSPNTSATIQVSGAGSTLTVVNTAADNGDVFLSIGSGATGSLSVATGGLVSIGGNMIVGGGGAITVGSGGILEIKGGLSETFGSVAAGSVNFQVQSGGTLRGGGAVSLPPGQTVTVQAGGRLEPGNGTNTGVFVSRENISLQAGSTLEVQLRQADGFDYDGILAFGNIAVGGSNLEIKLLTGFSAVPSDEFLIAETLGVNGNPPTGTVSGTFANLNAWGLITVVGGGKAFVPQYGATDVVLTDFARIGDVNRDGNVNNLDIAPFVGLLTGGGAAGAIGFAGDVNGDGVVNNLDIAPFVALLTGGRPIPAGDSEFAPLLAMVPEPTSLSLLALGGLLLGRRRRV